MNYKPEYACDNPDCHLTMMEMLPGINRTSCSDELYPYLLSVYVFINSGITIKFSIPDDVCIPTCPKCKKTSIDLFTARMLLPLLDKEIGDRGIFL